MGPGAQAVPGLQAGDGTGHGLRPVRVPRQSKKFPEPPPCSGK